MANNYDPKALAPQTRSIQPWQMTPERWVDFCARRCAEVFHGAELCTLARQMAIILHHVAVRDALAAGEDVLPEVYRYYPELRPAAKEARFDVDDDEDYTDDNAADYEAGKRYVKHA